MKTRLIAIILLLAALTGLCACSAAQTQTDADITETIEETIEETTEAKDRERDIAVEEDSEDAEETAEYSETALAEMEILDAIDYSNMNFLTEEVFYDLLTQILALHDVEMSRYPGQDAYFYYNYSNADSVRFLTVSKTMDEITADRAQAEEKLLKAAQELAEKQAALESGTVYIEPEKETAEEEPVAFDASKDVLSSQDYVVSFVISATDSSVDQELMFLTTSAVWAILHPNFNNTDDAFAYLWRGLYTVYGNSGGLSASTIVGIDSSYSFMIPGNAVEAWMDTNSSGDYVVALTLYAEYDEIIDVQTAAEMAGSIPSDLLS